MGKLLQNEWEKIFRRSGTYVMIGLLIVAIGVFAGFAKHEDNNRQINNDNWKAELQAENASLNQQLKENGGPKQYKDSLHQQIAINDYRISKNLAPNKEMSGWQFVDESTNFITFIGLITIITAAGIVASEFNWGTIKLLLIRPISRGKILVSKYVTVILFGLALLATLFVFSTILGFILFGSSASDVHLAFLDGKVIEQSMGLYLVKSYLLASVSILMLASFAFMISSVFRNSSLAIGISLFLFFSGASLTQLLAMKYDWAKYILFANTDLTMYTEGSPIIDGMTLSFSIVVLAVYFVLFNVLSFVIFNKRDVAA
jgi:ABC-2 type transport system permease protein